MIPALVLPCQRGLCHSPAEASWVFCTACLSVCPFLVAWPSVLLYFSLVALWFWESIAPASIDTSILRGIQLFMLYLVFGAVLLSPVLGGVGLGILVSRRHW